MIDREKQHNANNWVRFHYERTKNIIINIAFFFLSNFALVKALVARDRQAKYINFPDRTTECGSLINSYLTNKTDLNDETIHLLFTINRWEAMKKMEKLLCDGVTLIVDRYSYSGVAFSAAKGLDLEWCKAPERGLLKPDLVLLLTMTAAAISKRGGFGEER